MPTVIVRIHAPLNERLGMAQDGRRAILEQAIEAGESVGDLCSRLANEYPAFRGYVLEAETGRPLPHVLLLVDGQHITALDDYDTPLKDGAEIVLLPAYAGG